MRARGFTLIELAVVMGVLGLLLAMLIPTAARQFESKRAGETWGQLEKIKEALTGFALMRGRLPCPDVDGDGFEDRTIAAPACDALVGNLPHVELGVDNQDSWGRRFQYHVTQEFAYQTLPGALPGPLRLDMEDDGDITIQVAGALPGLITVSNTAPARAWSTGRARSGWTRARSNVKRV